MPVDVSDKHGLRIIAAMQLFWDELRREHSELPDVVIVTGTGYNTKVPKNGSFQPTGWKVTREENVHHPEQERVEGGVLPAIDRLEKVDKGLAEVFIAGERIAQGGLLVAQTLIHEGAHALGHVRNVPTTGHGGRYHNKEFARFGEELGLVKPAKADKSLGFSFMEIGEDATEKYKPWYEGFDDLPNLKGRLLIGEAIRATRTAPAPGAGRAGKRFAVECECVPARRIQVSPKTLETGGIICGVCEERFQQVAI